MNKVLDSLIVVPWNMMRFMPCVLRSADKDLRSDYWRAWRTWCKLVFLTLANLLFGRIPLAITYCLMVTIESLAGGLATLTGAAWAKRLARWAAVSADVAYPLRPVGQPPTIRH